jgi:hypothetical protein
VLSWIALGSPLILTGCDSEPSTTATVFNKEEIDRAMKDVVDALDTLEGDVDEFKTTNWREVVPEVESGVADLRNAIEKLKEELGYTA